MQGVKSTDGATADQTAVAVSANPSADRKLPTTDKTLDPAGALVDTTTMKMGPSAGQAAHDSAHVSPGPTSLARVLRVLGGWTEGPAARHTCLSGLVGLSLIHISEPTRRI